MYGLSAYSLFKDRNLNPVDYSHRNKKAEFYYQIINVGSDTKVLSSILRREKYLFSSNQAFDKIIGLRDIYSKEYRELVKARTIEQKINQKFIDSHNSTINKVAKYPDKIEFHFAIMELEAWFLGIKDIFLSFDDRLTDEKIEASLAIKLSDIDPEKEVFHPAVLINKIMELANDGYDKKKAEVNKFMGRISKKDFNDLFESDKCQAFNEFCNSLEVDTTIEDRD